MSDNLTTHGNLFYESMNIEPRNFREHMITLALLAAGCNHITEFGTSKGISTSALILARPKKLITYDILQNQRVTQLQTVAKAVDVEFEFKLQDTSKLEIIEHTDMLFIDSQHAEWQLMKELQLATYVSKYIAFHDTQTFGIQPEVENCGRGLLFALLPFMRRYREVWELHLHYANNNGFTVLHRRGA